MADNANKKQRKFLRATVLNAHAAFLEKYNNASVTLEEKIAAFEYLQLRTMELEDVHAAYNDALLNDDNISEQELETELKSDDIFKSNLIDARVKIDLLFRKQSNNGAQIINSRKALPKLDIPTFNGSVQDWLPFWSQFKKYHEDPALTNEDKFGYLIQATKVCSRATSIVQSYPPTGENYVKVIEDLEDRFGRKDLIIEYYMREMLSLVLQRATSNDKKTNIAELYDKVSSYIRSLETLGVDVEQGTAFMFPLIESSLPKDLLLLWQRSA